MPQYEISVPGSGSYRIDSPSDLTDEQVWQAVQGQISAAPPAPSKERTFGEATKDIGAGLVSGVGSLTQLPGQLYGLATGNMEDTGVLGAGKAISKYGEEMKSEGLKAREAERAQKIAESAKEGQIPAFKTALAETIKDPGLLLNFIAEQVPQLAVPFGVGRIGAGIARAGGAGAEAAGLAGAGAAAGAGVVQQGADVGAGAYDDIYKELKKQGISDKDAAEGTLNLARAAGASGALISYLTNKLPGAQKLEKIMAGLPAAGSRLGTAAKTVAGEVASEVPEEVGGKISQNLAMKEVKPDQAIMEGTGETAAMAALGAGALGGATGLASRQPAQEKPAEPAAPAVAPIAPMPPMPEAPQMKAPEELPKLPELGAPIQRPQLGKPAEPEAPVAPDTGTATPPADVPPPTDVPPPPKFTPEQEAALADYTNGLPTESADVLEVLQNRDRATPASIGQMLNIKTDPDYGRLKVSPDFSNGAPVVMSDVRLPEENMGITEMTTASNGKKIPVRYAVLDANDVFTSHDTNGGTLPDYADASKQGIRAVAGNGRIAGLQASYINGAAQNYSNELRGDTQHGISPEAIAKIQNPILVRVIPKAFVSKDIGDISNAPAALEMTPVERAKNDGNRFELSGIKFNETKDGSLELDDSTVMQFILKMPVNEQSGLLDGTRPNSLAYTRLNNAIFYKAYKSNTLINLFAQASDPEARLILRAMQKSAPSMARLEGTGEYDIRKNVVDAAELAVNARRNNASLKQFVSQGILGIDPNTMAVLEMFADNSRSGVRMGDNLIELADNAYKQSQSGDDMFGAVPKVPVNDLFKFPKNEKPEEPAVPPAPPPPPKPPAAPPKPPVAPPAKPAETKKPKRVERREFTIDKPKAQIAAEVDGMTMPEIAQWLVDNSPNKAADEIASKVLSRVKEFDSLNLFPNRVNVLFDGRRRADAQASANREWGLFGYKISVTLNGTINGAVDYLTGTDYDTILHELLHVATSTQLSHGLKSKESNDLKVLLAKVRAQIRIDMALPSDARPPIINSIVRGSNTVKNIKELLAWGLTDVDFQNYLATIKIGKTNGFSKLVSIVRNLLGINPAYETALDALMRTSESALNVSAQTIVKAAAEKGIRLKGSATNKSTKPPIESKDEKQALQKESDESVIGDMAGKVTAAASQSMQKRAPINKEALKGVNPAYAEALGKVFNPQSETFVDKVAGMKDGFWRRAAQGITDQYRTIKDYSEEAYMLARMSKTIDGALEGLLFHGHVIDEGGALNIDTSKNGLLDVLKPVGQETDRYMMWIALNREARLPLDKRSPNMADLLADRNTLAEGQLDGKSRLEIYRKVQKDMNSINKSVLDIALKKGLINSSVQDIAALRERTDLSPKEISDQIAELERNPGAYERFSKDIFYIPFYKQMESDDLQGASTASGLTSQEFSKSLEGKTDKPFGDLMENTLRNWSHILSASMKNAASNSTLDAAMNVAAAIPNLKPQYAWENGQVVSAKTGEVVGDGSLQFGQTKSGKGMVKTMVNGSPMYFEVLDPMLLDSISAIGYTGPKSKFLDVSRDFKNMLQYGVTLAPGFKVRNLIRDSVSAMAVSGLSKNPIANVIEGLSISDPSSPMYISALAGGGIFNFGSTYEGDQAKLVKRLLEKGVKSSAILDTPGKIKNALRAAHDAYQELGNKSEAANRMALYKQMRDKGMSHLEASYHARDLLDFSMQGSWPAFRLLTQVVPFMNARIQGLYKLGRDGVLPTARVIYNTATGKPIEGSDRMKAQAFSIVSTAVALASLALYFAFKDDEDFMARDEWDRDNFWWFKLPGMDYAFRIPKPFEIGAFGTIVERVAEQIFDQGAEGKQIEDSMKRMIGDTFSLNPMPQIFKPMVDLYANKDSFTGAPIESAGMERLSKEERITDNTSPLAILLGGIANVALPEKTEMSPVQVDYAIKAYFGWLGASAAWMSHYATMPFSQGAKPDNKWTDTMSMGFIKDLPSNQSKYVTSFYEHSIEINQAYADMRHFAEIGDAAKVEEIIREKGDLIAMEKFYDKTSKDMAKIRVAIRIITNDKDMPGDQKREEIDRLKILLGLISEQAEGVRKEVKRDKN